MWGASQHSPHDTISYPTSKFSMRCQQTFVTPYHTTPHMPVGCKVLVNILLIIIYLISPPISWRCHLLFCPLKHTIDCLIVWYEVPIDLLLTISYHTSLANLVWMNVNILPTLPYHTITYLPVWYDLPVDIIHTIPYYTSHASLV